MLVAHWVVRRERGPGPDPRARMRASATALIAAAGAVVVLVCGYWNSSALAAGRRAARNVAIYLVFAVGFALIVAALAAGRGPVVRALGARPLAWLGLISYGVFLWHLPLILTLKQVGALPEPLGLRLAVVLALAAGGRRAELALHRAPGDRLGIAPRAALGRASRRAGGDRRTGGARAARDGPGDAVTAAEVVGATLARLGVDVVFGLLGQRQPRGHQRARRRRRDLPRRAPRGRRDGMADGWARVTGRVGVVSVHQGPGLTNTMTALAEAAKSRTPLLVLAGDTPAAARRSNFRIDQHGLVESVGAIADRVHSPASAAADAARALARAQLERRPVVLMMAIDLQAADGDAGRRRRRPRAAGQRRRRRRRRSRARRELLAGARRPLIVGGRGAVLAGAGR